MKTKDCDSSGKNLVGFPIRFLSAGPCWLAALIFLCVAGQSLGAAKPAKQPIDISKGCVTAECHGDVAKSKFIHGPVNLKQCEPCHTAANGQHVFAKKTDQRADCLVCHEQTASKKVVHPPFKTSCTMCHQPHGGDNRYFVKGGLGADGCILCHTDVRKGLQKLHGPTALGECLACHEAHESNVPHLLTSPPGELCSSCHVDFGPKMKDAVSVHPPAKDNCSGCHNPHGGSTQAFLKGEPGKLCASCHADFLAKILKRKYPHHQPMTEGKACANCHDAHASKFQYLLAQKDEALCLSCHNKEIQAGDRTLPNVEQQLKSAKFLHGPLLQGNCSACHSAHGSDNANILDKAFPESFYTAFQVNKYDLCFNCHDKSIVMEEKSKAGPFRNGDLNLHYLHVHREKGRSCRACHHEHAADQAKHIRSEVAFGKWPMKIEYTKTETGGYCLTGCHKLYRYDREKPASNAAAK